MFKGKGFRVAPKGNASDTIIAYSLGLAAALFTLISIIRSIISEGNVERIYGVLLLSALIMSLTGVLFAIMGYYAEEGGITGKKISIWLNAVILVITAILLIKGL